MQYIKPAKHQQLTSEQEKELRMLYWYKHEIQKCIRIVWRCPLYNSAGYLQFLGSSNKLLLTSAIIEKLKADIPAYKSVIDRANATTNSNVAHFPTLEKAVVNHLNKLEKLALLFVSRNDAKDLQ